MDKYENGGISFIDEVEKIIDNVRLQTGVSPINISTWNSGEQYQSSLLAVLNLPKTANIADYIYSYDISHNLKKSLLRKINRNLFTSATCAISSIAMMLYKNAISRIIILQPSYYTVQECFKFYNGIDVVSISLSYSADDGLYHIPFDKLNDINADVIWITQPVFSTGVYLSAFEINKVCSIFSKVVVDCSLCSLEQVQILSKIVSNNTIIIGSPHKLIGLNSLKFCYVVGSNECIDTLEDIVDIHLGGLPATVPIALSHFLSENFELCSKVSITYIMKMRKKCEEIYKSFTPNILYNSNSCGTYGMILLNDSIFEHKVRHSQLHRIISETLVAFIPENTFDIHPNTCGFRINTLNDNILLPSIGKLLTYLTDHPLLF